MSLRLARVRSPRAFLAAAAAVLACLLLPAAADAAQPGALTQLPSPLGCLSNSAASGCVDSRGLHGASGVAVSPDGKNVYVVGRGAYYGSLAVFKRDTTTGELTQLDGGDGCWDVDATDGCSVRTGLRDPVGVALDRDGKNVYVVTHDYGGVYAFTRDTGAADSDGSLTPAGCVTEHPWYDSACADGRALDGGSDLRVSADGENVYAAAWATDGGSVAILDRDPDTGVLSQAADATGCVSNSGGQCADGRALGGARSIALSPDATNANVYVGARDSDAVAILQRDAATGDLTQAADAAGCIRHGGGETCAASRTGLHDVRDVEVSPDGRNLYAVSAEAPHTLAVLERDPATGGLTQSPRDDGCLKRWAYDGSDCRAAYGTLGSGSVTVSPDGGTVYIGSHYDDAIAVLRRDEHGGLRPLAGKDACVSEAATLWSDPNSTNGVCRDQQALGQVPGNGLAVAPDGSHLYAASGDSHAVAVFARNESRDPRQPGRMQWDLAEDFSTARTRTNPSPDRYDNADVWSFRRLAHETAAVRAPGDYVLLDNRTGGEGSDARWQRFVGWNAGAGGDPHISLTNGSFGQLHPDDDESAVIGWRNPVPGTTTFEVAGLVHDSHADCGDGIAWYLDDGTANLASGTIGNGGAARHIEETAVTMAQGDQLWLVIAPNGWHGCDSTRVDLRITGPLEGGTQTWIDGGPKALTSDPDPTFRFSSNVGDGATYECRLDAGEWTACGTGAADPRTQQFTDLADGDHTFAVRAKDTATDKVDPSPARRSFEVDATAPAATIESGPAGATRDTTPEFTFRSGDTDLARSECRLVASDEDPAWTTCSSPRRYDRSLAAGDYVFEVRAVDHAGNVQTPAAQRAFSVTYAPPPAGQPGELQQLAGEDGCWADWRYDGWELENCAQARELYHPAASVVSPLEPTSEGDATPVSKHVYTVSYASDTVVGFTRGADGSLTQIAGEDGCVANSARSGCQDVRGLYRPYAITMSADGRFVYVGTAESNTILTFSRDASTGRLTQLDGAAGCIADGTSPGEDCAPGRGLDGVSGIALSPDGEQLYVASLDSHAVAILDRDPTSGVLSQAGDTTACISRDGSGGRCAVARGLHRPRGIAVAPDGENVYATNLGRSQWWEGGHNGAIASFARDGSTGDLRQLGGESGCLVNDATTDGCRRGIYLAYTQRIALSPDGRTVYATSNDGLAVLDRDPETGALGQDVEVDGDRSACLTGHGSSEDRCVRVNGLTGVAGLAVAPDGRNVYAHSHAQNRLFVLSRDGEGRLLPLGGRPRCWSNDGTGGSCEDGRGLDATDSDSLALSPDGRSLYVTSYDTRDIAVFERSRPAAETEQPRMDWDLARDFRISAPGANPAGDRYGNDAVWQYRKAPGLGEGESRDPSAYALEANRLGVFAGRHGLRAGWWGSGPGDSDSLGAAVTSDDRFMLHTDSDGDGPAVGWTSPLPDDTAVHVEAVLENPWGNGSADGARWSLDRGATQIAGGVIAEGGRAQAIDHVVEVDQGETLWLTVAPRGNYLDDGIFGDLRITAGAESGPQTTFVGRAPGTLTRDATPAFGLSSSTAGATFECRWYRTADGAPAPGEFAACPAAGDGDVRQLPALDTDGQWVLQARAVADGTPDATPARRIFTVDTAAPTLTITAGPSGTIREASPSFTFSSNEPGVSECRLDRGATTGEWEPCLSPKRYFDLPDETYTFNVRHRDRAGNLFPDEPDADRRRTFRVATGASTLPVGALSQLTGANGCFSELATLGDGSSCVQGRHTGAISNLALTREEGDPQVTGDELDLAYAVSQDSQAVLALTRGANGALAPIAGEQGCIARSAVSGICAGGRRLYYPLGVAATRDDAPGPDNVYVVSHHDHSVTSFERDAQGGLTQLEGQKGCFAQGDGGCRSGSDVSYPRAIAVSPDGRRVYVAANSSVLVLDRDTSDGSLSQDSGKDGCWSDNGSGGRCRDGRQLNSAHELALSPDGEHLYVTGYDSHAVAAFAIEDDGDLRQLAGEAGCVRDTAVGAEGCSRARALYNARGIAVAPDGEEVYVASTGDEAIQVLHRQPDGSLVADGDDQLSCVQDDPGVCTEAVGLYDVIGVAVSPDGGNVYAQSATDNAVTAFTRRGDGSLAQLPGADACWSETGNVALDTATTRAGRCRDAKGLDIGAGAGPVVAPDGRHVYAAASDSDTIAAFERRAPASRTQPQRYVWNAAEDFRAPVDGEPAASSGDRYGHDGVWLYRTAPTAADGSGRAPGADGSGYTALGSFRSRLGYHEQTGWFDTASDDHPFIARTSNQSDNRLELHPGDWDGAKWQSAAVGWRNPLGREVDVDVSALFQDSEHGGTNDGVAWWVDNGTAPVQQGTLGGSGRGVPVDESVRVPDGGILWFGVAPHGNRDGDTTVLDVTITGEVEAGPQTTITSGPNSGTADATPTFGVASSAAGATFECRVGMDAWEACAGYEAGEADAANGLGTRGSITPGPLAEGRRTLEVRSVDGTTRDATPAVRRLTVDLTAPDTVLESGVGGLTRDRTPSFDFSTPRPDAAAEAEDRDFECRVNAVGGAAGEWTWCDTPYTVPALVDGTWEFEVRAVDRWGNADATPAQRQLTLETTPAGMQFGAISQLPGNKGCVSESGLLPDDGGTCIAGRELMGAVATAATDTHVFAASATDDAVLAFERLPDGSLRQLDGAAGCWNADGTDGCGDAHGLDSPNAMEVSPEGDRLYVGTWTSKAVLTFDIGVDGSLSQPDGGAGCISEAGNDGCADGRALNGISSLAITPGAVYATAQDSHAVAVLQRDGSGRLTQPADADGCVRHGGGDGCRYALPLYNASDIAVVGDHAYVSSASSNALVLFDINAQGGLERRVGAEGCVREGSTAEDCRAGRGMNSTRGVAISPDGRNVYTASSYSWTDWWGNLGDAHGLAAFSRDADTGVLTQLAGAAGCLKFNGTGEDDNCNDARAIFETSSLAMSHDGRTVYAAGNNSDAVTVFRRIASGPRLGQLRQLHGMDGCWSESGHGGTCRKGKALRHWWGGSAIAITPDDTGVYVAGRESHAIAAFARRKPRPIERPQPAEWDFAEDWADMVDGGTNDFRISDRDGAAAWRLMAGNGGGDAATRDAAAYADLSANHTGGDVRARWRPADNGDPWAWLTRNRRGNIHTQSGTAGRPAVVRWTNTRTEPIEVDVHALVRDGHGGCGNGVRWFLDHGSDQVVARRLFDGARAQSADRRLTVAAGGTIDLVVASAGGENGCDSTEIELNITAVPVRDTGIAPTAAETNDRTPAFRLTATDDGATFECRVMPPADEPWATCPGDPQEHETATLADGSYVFEARYRIGSDVDPTPAQRAIKIDGTAPAPGITTAGDGSRTHAYATDGALAELRDGRPTLSGTAGAKDGTDPDAVLDKAQVDVVITGTTAAGTEITPREFSMTRSGGSWSVRVPSGQDLPEGVYSVTVTQRDNVENAGTSEARTLRIDRTAPRVAFTRPAANQAINDTLPELRGTAGVETGDGATSRDARTVTVRIAANDVFDPAQLVADGTFTGTVAEAGTFLAQVAEGTALTEGTYTARVQQTDAAGNVGSTDGDPNNAVPDDVTFKIDRTRPVVDINGLPALTRQRSVDFWGNASAASGNSLTASRDLADIHVRIYRGAIATEAGLGSAEQVETLQATRYPEGDYRIDASRPPVGGTTFDPLADGTYTAVAEQRDEAGNVGRSALRVFKVDATAPAVSADTPATATADRTPELRGDAGVATGAEADRSEDLFPVAVKVYEGGVTAAELASQTPPAAIHTLDGARVADAARWTATVPSDLIDGTYSVVATQADAAGNTATSDVHRFKVDRTAPAGVTVAAPPAETKDPTPELSGTAGTLDGTAADSVADEGTVSVRVTRTHGDPLVRTFAATVGSGGAWSGSPADALPDGTYGVEVVQDDALGNRRTVSGSRTMKVDTTGPAPTITDGPSDPTADRTPSFTGAYGRNDGSAADSVADVGAVTVTIERTHGVPVTRTLNAVETDGTWTAAVPGDEELPDGTYRAVAEQADALENTGASSPYTFKVDKTAPTPTLDDLPAATRQRRPAFTGTRGAQEDGLSSVADVAALTLKVDPVVDGAATIEKAFVDTGDAAWSVQLDADLPDGSYDVTVVQADALANSRESQPAERMKVDATGPSPLIAMAPSDTADRTPQLAGTYERRDGTAQDSVADESPVTIRIERTHGEPVVRSLDATEADGGWTVAVPADEELPDGTYRAVAVQDDALGNEGTSPPRTFKVDATAPSPAVADLPAITKERRPTFSGTRGTQAVTDDAVADSAQLTLRVDPVGPADALTKTFVDEEGATWSTQLADDLPDGSYDVTVVQADALGNHGESAPAERIKVDGTAPAPTITQAPATTSDVRPQFGGAAGTTAESLTATADEAAGMELRIARADGTGTPVVTTFAATGDAWTAQAASDLPDGRYLAVVLQRDGAGNVGTSDEQAFKVDRTSPAPTVTEPSGTIRSRTPRIAGIKGDETGSGDTARDEDLMRVRIDRTDDASVADVVFELTDRDGANWSGDVPEAHALADGSYTATVRQYDVREDGSLLNEGVSDPLAFKVDATAPAPTVAELPAATKDDTPAFSGGGGTLAESTTSSADAGEVTVSVRRKGSSADPVTKTAAVSDGAWTTTFPDAFADGTYLVSASQLDAAGNRGESGEPREIEIDTTGPAATLAPIADTRSLRPELSGQGGTLSGATDDSVADVREVTVTLVRTDGTGSPVTATGTVADGGAWTARPSADLSEGRWRATARQADALGNETVMTPAREFDVDRTTPGLVLGDLESPTNDRRPEFGGDYGTLDGSRDGEVADVEQLDIEVTRGTTTVTPTATLEDGYWYPTFADDLTGDGEWTVTVRQRDAVGNEATVTRTFVLDTTPPETSIGTKPRPVTNEAPAVYAFGSNEPGGSFVCRIFRQGEAAPGFASCDQNARLPLGEDGTYVMDVAAVDRADNTDPSPERHTFRFDTDPPETSIAGGPAADAFAPGTFTFGFGSDEDASTYRCAVYRRGDAPPTLERCDASQEFTRTDGDYTLVVRAVDEAGNGGNVVTRDFSVDTGPPTTAIASGPSGPTNDTTPEFGFGADEPAKYVCRLDTPAGDGAWGACSEADFAATGTKAHTLTDDGAYTFRVRATDRAGNDEATGDSRSFTLDTAAPPTELTANPGRATKNTRPEYRFTSADATATFECRIDGSGDAGWAACTSPFTPDAALPAGPHTFEVRAKDPAGNVDGTPEAHEVKVDTSDPQVGLDAPASPGNVTRVTFAGAAGELGETATESGDLAPIVVRVYTGTTATGDAVATATGSRGEDGRWTAQLTEADALDDGTYTAVAEQSDAVGNVGRSASRTFVVDTAAPQPAFDPAALTRDRTPALSGDAGTAVGDLSAVTVTVLDGDTTIRTLPGTVEDDRFSVTVEDALPDGTYVARVAQDDAAGNTGTDSLTFKVDATSPSVVLAEVASPTKDATPELRGTAGTADGSGTPSADDTSIRVRIHRGASSDGQQVGPVLAADRSGADWSVSPSSDLPDGTYTAVAHQGDAAGNTGTSTARTFKVDATAPAPTLAAIATPTNSQQPPITGTLGTADGSAADSSADAGQATVIIRREGQADIQKTVSRGTGGSFAVDWGTTALDEGQYTARVRQNDAAGNTATSDPRSFVVDRTAPTGRITVGPSGTTNSTEARFAFVGEDGATFACKWDDGGYAPCTSPATKSLDAGPHTFRLRVTDAAGNARELPEREWVVDPAADQQVVAAALPANETLRTAPQAAPDAGVPVIAAITVPQEGDVTIAQKASAPDAPPSGWDFAGQRFQIDAPAATADAPLELTFELDASALPTGATAQTLDVFRRADGETTPALVSACTATAPAISPDPCVRSREALAGGDVRIVVLTSHASEWAFARDDRAPIAAITNGPSGEVASREASFTFASDEPGSTFECRLDSGAWQPCATPRALSGLGDGEHRFEVRAKDRAGNTGAATGRTWTVRMPVAVEPPPEPGPDPDPRAPADPQPPADPPTPGAVRLTPQQMREVAQRLLRSTSLTEVTRLNARGARAYAKKAVASGRLPLKRTQRRAALVAVVCPDVCAIVATQKLQVGRRSFRLKAQKVAFSGPGGSVVALRLPAKAHTALVRARRGRLSLRIAVTDATATTTRRAATLRLSVRR